MTIDNLRQYRKIKGRLLLLEAERDELVLKSRAIDGVGAHNGIPSNTVAQIAEEREKKQRDINSLLGRLNAVETYLSDCEEYYGTMLRLHYVEGKTWTAIAMRQGGKNKPNSIRMACHRYVENNP